MTSGWRIDKARRADHIDAVAALVAVERAEDQPAPVRVLGWV